MNKVAKILSLFFVGYLIYITANLIGVFVPRLIVCEILNLNIDQFATLVSNDFLFTKQHFSQFPHLVFAAINIAKLNILFAVLTTLVFLFSFYRLKKEWKVKIFTVAIFSWILLFTEFILGFVNFSRLFGSHFIIVDNIELMQITEVDDLGINTFVPNSNPFPEVAYEINDLGYRSGYEFDTVVIDSLKNNSNVIMFVGDSHTEGCCADPINKSFVDLIDTSPNISSLNFGVGGTDMLQYELITRKYLKFINPDLLVIVICDNDLIEQSRQPSLKHTLYYQTNVGYLSARYPDTHPDYEFDKYFLDWKEAKSFYEHNHTLKGNTSNFIYSFFFKYFNLHRLFKLVIRLSSNVSNKSVQYANSKLEPPVEIDYETKCSNIDSMAKNQNVPVLYFIVPSINDLNFTQLNEIKPFIDKYNIHYFTDFEEKDFIGYHNNHLNNEGHAKFASKIQPIIDSTLNYHTFSNSDTLN